MFLNKNMSKQMNKRNNIRTVPAPGLLGLSFGAAAAALLVLAVILAGYVLACFFTHNGG